MKELVEIDIDNWYKILHPRPAYIIAAGSKQRANFMTASWVMPMSEDPPRLIVSFGKDSYTYQLIKEYSFFTVNVLSIEHYELMYKAGSISGRNKDKQSILGVKLSFDTKTGAPRLESPKPIAVIEAKVWRIYDDVAEDVDLVIADVVAAYADTRLFNERYGWIVKQAQIPLHVSGRVFTTIHGFYMAGQR